MGGFWILQGWEGGFGAPHLPPNLNPKFQGRIQAGGSHTDTDGGGWDAGAGGSWVFLRPNNEKRRIPPQLGEQQQWGGGGAVQSRNSSRGAEATRRGGTAMGQA